MQLYCRQCGKIIQAENVNLDKLIAKCSSCNAVFSFADMYEDIHEKPKKKYDEEIPLPKNLSVESSNQLLRIKRRWRTSATMPIVFFTLFWNLIIWGFFAPIAFPNLLALTPFMFAGLVLIYFSAASLLNTTDIEVSDNSISITHHPIPFPNKNRRVKDIEQFFVFERVNHGRNSTSISYELHLTDIKGANDILLQGLETPDHALYIEQELERYYGIENRHVSGEYQ
jgi:hypothetical protein